MLCNPSAEMHCCALASLAPIRFQTEIREGRCPVLVGDHRRLASPAQTRCHYFPFPSSVMTRISLVRILSGPARILSSHFSGRWTATPPLASSHLAVNASRSAGQNHRENNDAVSAFRIQIHTFTAALGL